MSTEHTLEWVINQHKEQRPNYYDVAVHHHTTCECPDCISYYDDILTEEGGEVADEWLTFKVEAILVQEADDPPLQPQLTTEAQRAKYRELVTSV